ncbi:hypothetical protein CPB84DRAFT_1855958 [Gymnopilus junonius]|uniref:Uncharacterized protein n=1 Tax=Gymnopilus junonius TaxID=109634 RepID=A0A9P5TFZ0_GYMJU|nr:hypothetical protein CPB84DRAFT_1855958 [Gymnopilus junonius]
MGFVNEAIEVFVGEDPFAREERVASLDTSPLFITPREKNVTKGVALCFGTTQRCLRQSAIIAVGPPGSASSSIGLGVSSVLQEFEGDGQYVHIPRQWERPPAYQDVLNRRGTASTLTSSPSRPMVGMMENRGDWVGAGKSILLLFFPSATAFLVGSSPSTPTGSNALVR